MSLIQASLSCTVGATKCIQCLTFDLLSTRILKSRLPELTASFTLKLLRNVRCDKTSGSAEKFEFFPKIVMLIRIRTVNKLHHTNDIVRYQL